MQEKQHLIKFCFKVCAARNAKKQKMKAKQKGRWREAEAWLLSWLTDLL
jgi:hypothetical protein